MAIYIRLGRAPEIYCTRTYEVDVGSKILLAFLPRSLLTRMDEMAVESIYFYPKTHYTRSLTAVRRGSSILVSELSETSAKVAIDALELMSPEQRYRYLLEIDGREERTLPEVKVREIGELKIKGSVMKVRLRGGFEELGEKELPDYFFPLVNAYELASEAYGTEAVLIKMEEVREHRSLFGGFGTSREIYALFEKKRGETCCKLFVESEKGKRLSELFEKAYKGEVS